MVGASGPVKPFQNVRVVTGEAGLTWGGINTAALTATAQARRTICLQTRRCISLSPLIWADRQGTWHDGVVSDVDAPHLLSRCVGSVGSMGSGPQESRIARVTGKMVWVSGSSWCSTRAINRSAAVAPSWTMGWWIVV